MYKPANSMAHPSPAVISLHLHNSIPSLSSYSTNSTPPELISATSKNNVVQLVQLNPSNIHRSDVSFVQSPNLYMKSPETSSSSEDSEDSDPESPMAIGTTRNFFQLSDQITKSKESLAATHYVQIGQHNGLPTQIIPTSAIQPMISYQQPIFIQPNLDGRTQQILVPIATVPMAGPNSTNKISSGSPQGLYLQTCPVVQGTNSSQTLQVATMPNCDQINQSQQLLRTSLPIYINGQSTQIPSQSPQPIQIVTLANTPHVHS